MITSGNYRIPSHVPIGAQEIIVNLLRVNPMERMTIIEIKKHWWVKENIPKYLEMKPYQYIKNEKIIDPKILTIMNNIGYDKQKVINALCYEPEYQKNMYKQINNDNNEYKIKQDLKDTIVCYQLHYNLKHKIDFLKQLHISKYKNGYKKNGYKNVHKNGYNNKRKKNMNIYYIKKFKNKNNDDTINRSWKIGLSSILNPKELLKEILLILKQLNMEWYIDTKYCIYARNINDNNNQIKLQIYEMNHKILYNNISYMNKCYLLDLQKIDGNTFIFLNLSSIILQMIKRH